MGAHISPAEQEHEKSIDLVQHDTERPLAWLRDERDVESFDALAEATNREPRELMLSTLTHLRNVLERWEATPIARKLSSEDEALVHMTRVHLENACSVMRVLQGASCGCTPQDTNPPAGAGQGAPPGGSDAQTTAKLPYVPPSVTRLGSVHELTQGMTSAPPHRRGPFPR